MLLVSGCSSHDASLPCSKSLLHSLDLRLSQLVVLLSSIDVSLYRELSGLTDNSLAKVVYKCLESPIRTSGEWTVRCDATYDDKMHRAPHPNPLAA